MKKKFLVLYSLILLSVGLIFMDISFTSFGEIGKSGGIIVFGKLVVKDFIKNDFSLLIFIFSFLASISFISLSILTFPFPIKK